MVMASPKTSNHRRSRLGMMSSSWRASPRSTARPIRPALRRPRPSVPQKIHGRNSVRRRASCGSPTQSGQRHYRRSSSRGTELSTTIRRLHQITGLTWYQIACRHHLRLDTWDHQVIQPTFKFKLRRPKLTRFPDFPMVPPTFKLWHPKLTRSPNLLISFVDAYASIRATHRHTTRRRMAGSNDRPPPRFRARANRTKAADMSLACFFLCYPP